MAKSYNFDEIKNKQFKDSDILKNNEVLQNFIAEIPAFKQCAFDLAYSSPKNDWNLKEFALKVDGRG